jgi:L-ascorbate metabolism protein UlaG (beta-lactamase superfamily)
MLTLFMRKLKADRLELKSQGAKFWLGLLGLFSFFCGCGLPRELVPVPRNHPPETKVESPLTFTFVGHASVLVQGSGINLITDPQFDSWAAIVPRLTPPGVPFEDLPPIDYVVISHAHYDHLNLATLRRFPSTTTILTPRNVSRIFAHKVRARVVELSPWQAVALPGIRITGLPVHHPNAGRWSFLSRDQGALGYLVEIGEKKIAFLGDTAYGEHFKAVGGRFPDIDVGLIPIGCFYPRWIFRRFHVDPAEALQIFRDIRAQHMIPICWGTFPLTFERLGTPPCVLKEEASRREKLWGRIVLLRGGETWRLGENYSPPDGICR